MKIALATLLFFATNLTFAKDQIWTTINQIHPLWEVLNIPAVDALQDSLKIQKKEVGGVVCTKAMVPTENKTARPQTKYQCTFPAKLSNKQALELFHAVNVAALDTSGAYTQVKTVDKLVVIGSSETNIESNDSRIYLRHPCQTVKSLSQAQKCMRFWGEKVLPSFESDNETDAVLATPENKVLAKKVMGWCDVRDELSKKVETSDYLAMMAEYQPELHFYYYSLRNGKNVYPQEILDYNTVDMEYLKLGKLVKETPQDKIPALTTEILDAFFLKSGPDSFIDIGEAITDSIASLKEDQ